MTKDAFQSLIALGSVVLLVGFFVVSQGFLKGVEFPKWLLPLGLVLMTIGFIWRFIDWTRAKRRNPKSDGE